MYSASFMFIKGEYDDEFYALNTELTTIAKSYAGFLGGEVWHGKDNRVNAVYYWENLDDLHAFACHPRHVEAKRQYKRWYQGYQIVLAEIIKSYGDGNYPHITPNQRKEQSY